MIDFQLSIQTWFMMNPVSFSHMFYFDIFVLTYMDDNLDFTK